MTKAQFNFKNEILTDFKVSGHADYKEEGSDIVCSAITTALFTTLNLLERLYLNKYQVTLKPDYVEFVNQELLSDNIFNNIVQNLIDSLKIIEDEHPHNLHVIIK